MYQKIRLATQIYGLILAAVLLAAGVWVFNLFYVAAAVITALFAGRIFCGWLCPMGFWTERVLKKISFGARLPGVFKHNLFRYLFALIFIGFLVYMRMTDLVTLSYFPFIMMGVVFILSTTLGVIFLNKTWCSHICPWGIVQSIVARLGYYKLAIGGDCSGCKACERACLIDGVLDEAVDKKQDSSSEVPILDSRCIRCHSCVEVCPNGAFEYVTSDIKEKSRSGEEEKLDYNV